MGVAVTYVVYLAISVALTVFVGSALSRSGRVFLRDAFGDQTGPADAASRLIVVGFYLLTLGFVTLTMRMSGEIGSVRQAIQVLSVKIGEVLLVLGALYLANIGFLARIRRRTQAQPFQPALAASRPGPGLPQPGRPAAATATPPGAGSQDAGIQDAGTRDASTRDPGPAGGTAADAQERQAGPARSRDQGLWRPRPRQAIH